MTFARRLALVLPLVSLSLALPIASAHADLPHWGAEDINTQPAWGVSTGAGVKVAVIDTGVMSSHPELVGRVVAGGWGFDGSTEDAYGHGTSVAGIIAADANDGTGMYGVAPDASIVPFRAFNDNNAPDPERVATALDRAGASGARVVNASFASQPYDGGWQKDADAIASVLAAHRDTLYVVAAGNDGSDNDRYPTLPCNVEAANLLCVGAYDRSHKPWNGGKNGATNYGAKSVDLFAPGDLIYAPTVGKDPYGWFAGTSMATAFVSGEAALLFSKVPRLTPEAAIRLILSTSRYGAMLAGKAVSGSGPDAAAALAGATVDSDGDGVYDVVDACPQQAYPSENGCPPAQPAATPAATPPPVPAPPHAPVPQLRSLTTKVSRCAAGRKSCRTSATVRLKPDRTATVSLRVERQVCKPGRCRWTSYMTKALSATVSGASVVVRGKRMRSLPQGRYRVVGVPSSSAGAGKPVTRMFRVR